jgi:hypothetical protein
MMHVELRVPLSVESSIFSKRTGPPVKSNAARPGMGHIGVRAPEANAQEPRNVTV